MRKLPELRLERATCLVLEGYEETVAYYDFPSEHWRHVRTNTPLERLNREICRRRRVVGSFPDDHAALMLVSARLRYIVGQNWGTQRYLSMHQETFKDRAGAILPDLVGCLRKCAKNSGHYQRKRNCFFSQNDRLYGMNREFHTQNTLIT